MEKKSNDLFNLSNLPAEIQQHIAAYLDAPALGFFAQSHKQTLKNVLPLLCQSKTLFPLLLTSRGNSTYFTQAHQLFVCGENGYGQLGLGDKKARATFTSVPWPAERGTIQQLVTGFKYTIALTQDKRLWVCGSNVFGQLGLGDNKNRFIFSAVPWSIDQGRIEQVIVGGDHTLVLTDANRLWVCGKNEHGQLGLGDEDNRSTFTAVPWPAERGKIQQIIAGEDHSLVLTDDHRLWVCGNNEHSQLGLGDNKARATFTAVPWPAERGKIEKVIASGSHTVVLTQDKSLWVCGNNEHGQLGLDDKVPRATFTAVPWPADRDGIQQVIASENCTIVLTQANQLWVCGYNESGQLGLGDNKARATFSTFTPVKVLPAAMQQVFMFDNTFKQLINLGTALITLTPGNQSNNFLTQHRLDEPEGQPPLKKMRL